MESEKPTVIAVQIGDEPFFVAAVSAFGSGHLWIADWWQEDGNGAALMVATYAMSQVGQPQIHGFIHFHRSILRDRTAVTTAAPGSPTMKAIEFFTEEPGEYSAFVPVVFERSGGTRPWRARPPT